MPTPICQETFTLIAARLLSCKCKQCTDLARILAGSSRIEINATECCPPMPIRRAKIGQSCASGVQIFFATGRRLYAGF